MLPTLSPEALEKLRSIGITACGYIPTADIEFKLELREICNTGRCGNFKKTWACPPGAGTIEECREKCLKFPYALVFMTAYPLEDAYDFEGMMEGHEKFKDVCDALYSLIKPPFHMLSNEGCLRCEKCTYPDSPCRFPEKLFPSLEGYGIFVYDLAKKAGIPYKIDEEHVCFFGMLCTNGLDL